MQPIREGYWLALIAVPALARDKDKEEKRLENSGRVLKEILDISTRMLLTGLTYSRVSDRNVRMGW
jgi:hypothetical protein